MKKRTRPKPNASFVLRWKLARNWPRAKFKEFRQRLFQPVDATPLGIFRFLFGFLLCVEFFLISSKSFPADYIQPSFHFTYPLFDLVGLKPLPQPYLWAVFHVLRISSVGIMLGLFTRISLIVFTSAFGYFFFLESTVYSNHYYLIFLLSFLMCFGQSGSVFSFDNLIHKNTREVQVDYWEVYLLRFQICVVFFFGALAKMNAEWLVYAAPLYLNFIKQFSLLGHPFQEKWMAVLLSWGGMVSDLGLAVLLTVGRWRKWTFVWLCLFNGLNVVFFGLGIKTFPYLMVSSYILFVPTSGVRKVMAWVVDGRSSNQVVRSAKR